MVRVLFGRQRKQRRELSKIYQPLEQGQAKWQYADCINCHHHSEETPRAFKVANAFLSILHSIAHNQAPGVIHPRFQSCTCLIASGHSHLVPRSNARNRPREHVRFTAQPRGMCKSRKGTWFPILLFYRKSVGKPSAKRINNLGC